MNLPDRLLVVSSPRERPMHPAAATSQRRLASHPPFDIDRILMNADPGTIDHLKIAIIGARDGPEQAIYDADLPPADEAVDGSGRAIALGDATKASQSAAARKCH